MKYYETLYIVHPALESGRLKDIILSLDESLKNLGGKILSIDLWGKKRLAYLIDKQKYGTYVKLQFTGEGNCTSSFGMELEHNPNILSYLTILIQESDVIEQENDIDTQIAGQSRETQRNDGDRSKDTKEMGSSKQNESEKDSDTHSVPSEVDLSLEDPSEESVKIDIEQDSSNGDDINDSSDKSEAEVDTSEDDKESMKENQENTDDTSVVSEGE